MTQILTDYEAIANLPVGSKIVDDDGDTGEKLANGDWYVPGFGSKEDAFFFSLPVEVETLGEVGPSFKVADMPEIHTLRDLEALPDGTLIVGLDPQETIRFKQDGNWIDPKKPIGTTWGLNTYVLARRYGVQVVLQPV
ncbi:hypothetical protein SEA_CELESTE_59 [Streptomyces phage Celeste]|uniref:Uncharacterized protein n=1 Tax=Streptomyces phage Celeste TaxID=2024288 RepID=A0A291AVN5_9CAUD|nr:hypothetical protein SEA_CELESTE_59 [Streptomyces phage Celeste]